MRETATSVFLLETSRNRKKGGRKKEERKRREKRGVQRRDETRREKCREEKRHAETRRDEKRKKKRREEETRSSPWHGHLTSCLPLNKPVTSAVQKCPRSVLTQSSNPSCFHLSLSSLQQKKTSHPFSPLGELSLAWLLIIK